ncbi:uncharacterized protein E0L32_002835 [Thyridium curvatum]|uniref:Uncharacterized protein n=1 Tax=Thyridium curvatum TaxID=1093900 RepID=A0A507BG41_9PEZI|nr:uncharacterized protein E0L32_002835 [Thyridium curvatum]TPX17734.1 hypothetical protein E0L32_002835 [Thyridium curvatum]
MNPYVGNPTEHGTRTWAKLQWDSTSLDRPSDRAMVEEAIELMLDANQAGKDPLARRMVALLHCFLDIEAAALQS